VDEPERAFEEIDGDRTPVDCFSCGEAFPFRECRLFLLDLGDGDEYVFFCEPCHDVHVMEPFREMADERGLTAEAWARVERAARSKDPARRAEATTALIRYKALKRGAPPSPESN
jgi:hypothetical protein